MSTHKELDFTTMSFGQTQPVVKQDDTIHIGDLRDPEWAFLCMDFPSMFSGTTSGSFYLSPLQYLLYGLCTMTGNSNAERILKYTKEYTAGLQDTKFTVDIELAEKVSRDMKVWINLADPVFQDFYATKFISIIGRACCYVFAQHENLRQALLSTGERPIVFVSPDAYWGNGSSNPSQMTGQNVWGRTLMEVRVVFARDLYDNMPWIPEMIESSKKPQPAPVVEETKEVEAVEVVEASKETAEPVEKPISHPLPENLEEQVEAAPEVLEKMAEVPIQEQVTEALAEVITNAEEVEKSEAEVAAESKAAE